MTDYITGRELEAHLGPIRDDISEIKGDVKSLLVAPYETSVLGGRGHAIIANLVPTLIAVTISVTAAVLIALFIP